MNIAIIDYGSGNLRSASKAFERAARELGRTDSILVTSDPETVAKSDRIVLPGVGAFADCQAGLRAVDGMWQAIEEAAVSAAKPFLGICVGMQLMASRGLEFGTTQGYGWIAGDVVPIEPRDPALKIPHMGWNTLELIRPHPVLDTIPLGDGGRHAYFVHSFHLKPERTEDLVAEVHYGTAVTAVVAKDNMIGTQFHPEKSQMLGLRLIANFLQWAP